MSSEQYGNDESENTGGESQSEGGENGGGGEENNEADMIFAPEASKPGRNAGMLMVAFVMIGVGVIYFMRVRGGPAKAQASAEVIKAQTAIDGFIQDRGQVEKMAKMLKETQKVVEQFNTYPNNPQVDVSELKHDPFKFVSQHEKANEDPAIKAAAEAAKKTALRKAKFADDVGNIKVQYLMVSATRKSAMINNKLVTEGQDVDGFTIEKITSTAIIVARDGMRAEVKQLK